jgi:outer membrane protein TolC
LFDGGEGSASRGQVRSQLQARRLDVAQLKQQIQNNVRTLYFELKTTDRHIEVLEATRRNRRRSLEIARHMRAQGALTEIELLPYEQLLREAERDLLQALADYESTRLQLVHIVGQT